VHEEERRLILNMVSSGKISVAESLRLLEALDQPGPEEAPAETGALLGGGRDPAGLSLGEAAHSTGLDPEVSSRPGAEMDPESAAHKPAAQEPAVHGTEVYQAALEPADYEPVEDAPQGAGQVPLEGEPTGRRRDVSLPRSAARMRKLWQIPFWIGAGILTVGALLMSAALQGAGIGFLFLCASIPFLLGLGVLLLAWEARLSPWLHLRVHQAAGEWPSTIALSFPLPVRLATWALRLFGSWIPLPGDLSAEDMILALESGVSPDHPIYIEVEDGGDHVQILIG
jgi:hypothetical protein